jgi:hypothetical protein
MSASIDLSLKLDDGPSLVVISLRGNVTVNLPAVVGVFCGFLQFPICFRKQLLGLSRVTSKVVVIVTSRGIDLFVGLDNVMLRLREISMPVGINVLTGRLGNRYACTHEHTSQCTAQHHVFRLHGNYSFLDKREPSEFRGAAHLVSSHYHIFFEES